MYLGSLVTSLTRTEWPVVAAVPVIPWLSGMRRFQIGARYQVCSDKLCLPPRTDKLDVAIRIAGRK